MPPPRPPAKRPPAPRRKAGDSTASKATRSNGAWLMTECRLTCIVVKPTAMEVKLFVAVSILRSLFLKTTCTQHATRSVPILQWSSGGKETHTDQQAHQSDHGVVDQQLVARPELLEDSSTEVEVSLPAAGDPPPLPWVVCISRAQNFGRLFWFRRADPSFAAVIPFLFECLRSVDPGDDVHQKISWVCPCWTLVPELLEIVDGSRCWAKVHCHPACAQLHRPQLSALIIAHL